MRKPILWLLAAALLCLTAAGPVLAAPVLPVKLTSRAAVLMEVESGQVLYEHNAVERLDPASLTKIMTVHLAFTALHAGEINLTDEVTVSEAAWRLGGSTMFLNVGDRVTIDQLLRGITVVSGNDATLAAAEKIAGSAASFVARMNATAAELGLSNTQFRNTHGLTEAGHYMSAGDAAALARAHIKAHPESLAYHSQQEYEYGGIKQPNRNSLLGSYPGCDGLKTGQTDKAGYCLVATAQREPMRLIAVIMGAPSIAVREQEATELLNFGFSNFARVHLADAGQVLTSLRVWKGAKVTVPAGPAAAVDQVVAKGEETLTTTQVTWNQVVQAPVATGQKLGEMAVLVNGQELRRVDLVALEAIPRGGFFRRFTDSISYFFARIFRRI